MGRYVELWALMSLAGYKSIVDGHKKQLRFGSPVQFVKKIKSIPGGQ